MKKSLETDTFKFRYFLFLTFDTFKNNRKFLEFYAFILVPALILSNFIYQENIIFRDKIIFSAFYGFWLTLWQIPFTLKLEENISGILHNFNTFKITCKKLIPLILADILFILIIGLSSLFFIIPGIIMYINFLFYKHAIILRNKSIINAFTYSCNLTKCYRWRLLLYAFLLSCITVLLELLLFIIFRNYQYDIMVVFLSSLILVFCWTFFVNIFIYLELNNNILESQENDTQVL